MVLKWKDSTWLYKITKVESNWSVNIFYIFTEIEEPFNERKREKEKSRGHLITVSVSLSQPTKD